MAGTLGRLSARAQPDRTVDMATRVGSCALANPVMTASGTAGLSDELGAYVELSELGAVVTKSLLVDPWPGNEPPRLHETPAGMLNSVGLQGPGLSHWLESQLPRLETLGATVVVSVWGRSLDDYAAAAEMLDRAGPRLAAVEVNVSCPNHHDRNRMFAHDPGATRSVLEAMSPLRVPMWAKLSPNVTDLAAIAEAAGEGGASAVTLINTVMGMALDPETRSPRLGGGGGGLSGPAIHPFAVRAVWDVRRSLPGMPIVGVGGVASGWDAAELMLAGASAVQVGTATFADPRAVARVGNELEVWCERHGVRSVDEIVGGAHEH